MAWVPFSNANRISDAFLVLLADRGITPAMGGKLEDELLSVTQLLELVKNPKQAASLANESQIIWAAAGVHDFAAKVLAARKTPEFSQFDEHLKLIATRKLK